VAHCSRAVGPAPSVRVRLSAVLIRPTWLKTWRNLPSILPSMRITLFGEQSEVVAQRQKTLEQDPGFGDPALQDVVIGLPEAAGEESAVAFR
jgi:hypothetical protein